MFFPNTNKKSPDIHYSWELVRHWLASSNRTLTFWWVSAAHFIPIFCVILCWKSMPSPSYFMFMYRLPKKRKFLKTEQENASSWICFWSSNDRLWKSHKEDESVLYKTLLDHNILKSYFRITFVVKALHTHLFTKVLRRLIKMLHSENKVAIR